MTTGRKKKAPLVAPKREFKGKAPGSGSVASSLAARMIPGRRKAKPKAQAAPKAKPKGNIITRLFRFVFGGILRIIWWVTLHGRIGTLNPETGQVHSYLVDGEAIQNSFAVADNGVFIVTDHALYGFSTDRSGKPM